MTKILKLIIDNEEILDPRSVDRKIHSAYVKYCSFCGLHENVKVDEFKNKAVHYFYDRFYFTVDGNLIYDWTLNAQSTDLMFQYATKTFKTLYRQMKK